MEKEISYIKTKPRFVRKFERPYPSANSLWTGFYIRKIELHTPQLRELRVCRARIHKFFSKDWNSRVLNGIIYVWAGMFGEQLGMAYSYMRTLKVQCFWDLCNPAEFIKTTENEMTQQMTTSLDLQGALLMCKTALRDLFTIIWALGGYLIMVILKEMRGR